MIITYLYHGDDTHNVIMAMVRRWRVFTFQHAMQAAGVARFGLQVSAATRADRGTDASSATNADGTAVKVAAAVLAPIGREWSRL